jgi:2-hydroxyacyl-CoA lyase 1
MPISRVFGTGVAHLLRVLSCWPAGGSSPTWASPSYALRLRLDAGTYGTMGIGMGFAIAAAVVHPDKPIISVTGDSALGFSGMEIETACRYKLPVKVVVLNNGGIGRGIDELPKERFEAPPGVLSVDARYDRMMEAFGGKGWFIEDPKHLRVALDQAMKFDGPALVNVKLHPSAGRKPQEFGWLTT